MDLDCAAYDADHALSSPFARPGGGYRRLVLRQPRGAALETCHALGLASRVPFIAAAARDLPDTASTRQLADLLPASGTA